MPRSHRDLAQLDRPVRWGRVTPLALALVLTFFAGDAAAEAKPAEPTQLSSADWQNIAGQLSANAHGRALDPPSQQAYLKASNPDSIDLFGYAVAIDGDTVVIGAPLEDSMATGVNGNQGDNSLEEPGAAYVFVRSGTTWTQQAYLKASNTDDLDLFGSSVAIDGDTVVVGAFLEASSAVGVNGNQGNDVNTPSAGAAYVFVRTGTTWSQQAYLKASNTEKNDFFGSSVAVYQDTVAVGAYGEDGNSAGINGNQNNNSAADAGAVYVFTRSGSTWSQQAYIKASNPGPQDFFGESLALDGDTLVVGATGEDSSATGTDGDQNADSALESGAAYVFSRSGNTWTQSSYVKALNTGAGDLFGTSVAVYQNTVAVGAPGEDSNATGVNGDQSNNSSIDSGAAYAYRRTGSTWTPQAYLKASNTEAGDNFGDHVAIAGNKVVVGATLEDSNALGIDGDQGNNLAGGSGAAYVFKRFGSSWSQLAYFKASNTDPADNFGSSLAMDGTTLIVGASWEYGGAPGVNGNQGDNSAPKAGSAYVYLVPSSFPLVFVPDSTNTAMLEWVDVPVELDIDGTPISGIAFSLEFDDTCLDPDLNNDSVLDHLSFSVPAAFTATALFDNPGRIDVSVVDALPPIGFLPSGELVRIGFQAICSPPPLMPWVETPIHFSTLFPPSFSDDFGQDVEGTSSDGAIRIWEGQRGDCNGSGNLSIGDVISVGLEIFDGDGDYWLDCSASTFAGNPVGCDANITTQINAADVICTNLLLFGGSCSTRSAPDGQAQPLLEVSPRFEAGMAWIGATLSRHGQPVASLAFSLLLDAGSFDLAGIDLDNDGRPDNILFPQGQPGLDLIRWTPGGSLDILLADLSQQPLPEGLLVEIGVPALGPPPLGALAIAPSPRPSFGSTQGLDIAGTFEISGQSIFGDGFETGDVGAWSAVLP